MVGEKGARVRGAIAGLRSQLEARQPLARGIRKRARRAAMAVADAKARARARNDADIGARTAGLRRTKTVAHSASMRSIGVVKVQQAVLEKLVKRR
jgi:hypothetical protein